MIDYKDVEIYTKSTKEYKLIFYEDGNIVDITGWKVYFTVKENMEDTDINAKINKTISSHTDPTNGKTTISLTTSDTNLDGTYYYDISYLDDNSNQGVIFSGRITFIKPVLQTRN